MTRLDGVTVALPAGRVTAVFGPSGSGKSSLLRLLNRLDEPSAGAIRYRGQPLPSYPPRALRCRVGFVFQVATPFPGTVRDNLTLAASLAGAAPSEVAGRVERSARLASVDDDLLGRDAARLSVGQMQRVGLARALMTGPETLLLDEPTASLDPETADDLAHTIADLSGENGLTVVMATHRLAEAERLAHFGVMLDQGRLVEAGAMPALLDSDHPRLRAFLERVP